MKIYIYLFIFFAFNISSILYAQKDEEVFVFQINQGVAFLTQYTGEYTIVKIPSTYKGMKVTAIAAYTQAKQKHGAFEGLDIDSVEIPSSIMRIGINTFYNCENIRNIKLPSSISFLGESAFEGCSNLQKINIPEGISKISNRLFASCVNLKEIILPNSITDIGSEAFLECNTLTTITIPKKVTKIGFAAFSACDKLIELKVEALNPPIVTEGFLDNTSPQLKIKVPMSQLAVYQQSSGWIEYAKQIIGF